MKVLNKEIIENFSCLAYDNELCDAKYNLLCEKIDEAYNIICDKIPIIGRKYDVEIFNEFDSDLQTTNSSLDVLIVLYSPQLEINTYKIFNNKFLQYWRRFKQSWKNSHKKKKGKKKEKTILVKEENYTLESLLFDFYKTMIPILTQESTISIMQNQIHIEGKEFGYQININFAFKTDIGLKLYEGKDNKLLEFSDQEIYRNIKDKNLTTDGNYAVMVRTFINLFYNLEEKNQFSFFIESLLFNVPDELFYAENVYKQFLQITNYLSFIDISKFKSIINKSISMWNDEIIGANEFVSKNFLNKLGKII